MLTRVLLAMICALPIGCTSTMLRHSTATQVKTLTDLQHQIVLNNLAAFACNPDTIPSQANLSSGATQIVDFGSTNSQVLTTGFNSLLLTLGLSRGVVDQWSTVPVTDEMSLRLLRVAYRRSLGVDEDLYTEDLANRLAHRLKAQLPNTGDLGISNSLMYARGPALPQLLDRAGWKGDDNLGFQGSDPAVKLWRKDVTDIISLASDRIIQQNEYLIEDNLAVAPVLVDGQPYVHPGEKVPRVKVVTPYAAEIRRQVYSLNNYVVEINSGWVCRGCKKDVPKNVCYFGYHDDMYVWILPENIPAFEDFTLRILRLATLIQQPNTTTAGVMYSPIQTR